MQNGLLKKNILKECTHFNKLEKNCPKISPVRSIMDILTHFGVKIPQYVCTLYSVCDKNTTCVSTSLSNLCTYGLSENN